MIKTNENLTPAKIAAKRLSACINLAASTTERSRNDSTRILWNTKDVEPSAIFNELEDDSKALAIKTDIVVRISQALTKADPLAAFAASSPVPEGKDVILKDENGDVVDLTVVIAALLMMMATVKQAEIVSV